MSTTLDHPNSPTPPRKQHTRTNSILSCDSCGAEMQLIGELDDNLDFADAADTWNREHVHCGAYLIGREDGAEAELELWASDSNSPVCCTSRSIRDTRRTIGPDCDA